MESAEAGPTKMPTSQKEVFDAFFPKTSKVAERRYVPPEGTHSGYKYLPGDHLIGEMTQHQRDHILARMPKTARER